MASRALDPLSRTQDTKVGSPALESLRALLSTPRKEDSVASMSDSLILKNKFA